MMETKVKYGEGVLNELGDIVNEFGKKRVLLVTDKGVEAAGLVGMVTDVLNKSGITDINIFDNVKPNPRTDAVNEGGGLL